MIGHFSKKGVYVNRKWKFQICTTWWVTRATKQDLPVLIKHQRKVNLVTLDLYEWLISQIC